MHLLLFLSPDWLTLRRRANARNVRLHYPYWQYTDLFIFRFLYFDLYLCLPSTLRLFNKSFTFTLHFSKYSNMRILSTSSIIVVMSPVYTFKSVFPFIFVSFRIYSSYFKFWSFFRMCPVFLQRASK